MQNRNNKSVNNQSNQSLKQSYQEISRIQNLVQKCNRFNEDLEILNYINSGSSGIVYEGRARKGSKKKVALKFILNCLLDSKRDKKEKEKIKKRINNEIQFLKKLKQKNITLLHGVYEIPDDNSCMVLELAKYHDLEHFQKSLIQKKTLSETLLVYISKQILDALYYCHQSQITHTDIKHQNVLIDENLNIKLTDFSVSFTYAGFEKNKKMNLPFAGTSLFMCPEILGHKEIFPIECNKIDIFSFGILLYNLAYAEYPYNLTFKDKKNFKDIKTKIEKNGLVFPKKFKKFSPYFTRFLSCLLEKDITKRISINDALKDHWIKGADLVFQEKEKINDLEKFLVNIITDNIRSFNNYLLDIK
jgi:serine/threonine protein kinase